ncbi:MAG TPA: PH domain-containing protein [Chitinophagaceae bacterium]
MEFSNPAIDLALLPKAEEITLKPVERSYLNVLRLEWLITAIVVLVVGGLLVFFIKRLHQPFIIGLAAGVWLLITIFSYWVMNRSFKRKAYAIRDKDVLYQTGWIVRRLQICPFNRIQHCSVHSGPLERQFGLAALSLFTAGSEGSDMKIPGLTEESAASIREFIMQKIRTDEQVTN